MTAEFISPPEVRSHYEAVIGLEVHCQLLTNSKIFAADTNAFGAEPNTNISVITLGHPGTLPKLNRKAIEYAVRMGLACHSEITRHNVFARKNYFYPDLPKGYQLSQDKGPICVGGGVLITTKNLETGFPHQTTVQLHHIHLEEDAGKSIHDGNDSTTRSGVTRLDYNRAGTPLIEMVTEPCLHTADEAGQFLTEVRRLVRYLGICDGNMEEGSLRCDVNVSIRPTGATHLGTKVEVKNLNSIRNVMRAIDSEFRRQVDLTESGGGIVQETRTFDAQTGQSQAMREKETMNDYRYFPDPDLPPLVIAADWIERVRSGMPELPRVMAQRFQTSYGLQAEAAALMTQGKDWAVYFETAAQGCGQPRLVANWMMGELSKRLNAGVGTIGSSPIDATTLALLISRIADGTVSNNGARLLFDALWVRPGQDVDGLIASLGLQQMGDRGELAGIVDAVLAASPKLVEEFRGGKEKAFNALVGQAMKATQGKANPAQLNEMLREKLG